MKRWIVAVSITSGLVLLLVSSSYASTTILVDNAYLHGGGTTIFEPETAKNLGCGMTPGYVSVSDGSYNGEGDATDGGFAITVAGFTYDDLDGNGTLSGEQLTTGPTTLDGLQVVRIDRALSTSPTLRSLVKLTNPSGSTISVQIRLGTNLGSDSNTVDDMTSSGNASFAPSDRWIISSDGSLGNWTADPAVTEVLYGKQAPVKVHTVVNDPGGAVGVPGCMTVTFEVKVPGNSTKYMMFFMQLHDNMDATLLAAKNDAAKFNHQSLNSSLLAGVSPGLRSKINNWKLT